jgi:hypothetical protein
VVVSDSTASSFTEDAFLAISGGAGTGITIADSTATHSTRGARAIGAGAVVRIASTTLAGNSTGISGNVVSFGDNHLIGNAADGTPAGSASTQ